MTTAEYEALEAEILIDVAMAWNERTIQGVIDLMRMLQFYGDHRQSCYKLQSIDNDCSCGWSTVRMRVNTVSAGRK